MKYNLKLANTITTRVKITLQYKKRASSEDRTHDLEIMRLTRCLLRHRGYDKLIIIAFIMWLAYVCDVIMQLHLRKERHHRDSNSGSPVY